MTRTDDRASLAEYIERLARLTDAACAEFELQTGREPTEAEREQMTLALHRQFEAEKEAPDAD